MTARTKFRIVSLLEGSSYVFLRRHRGEPYQSSNVIVT